MANKNPKIRPTPEEAIQFFETIQHSLSNILPKPPRKIALFSVNEYLHYIQEIKNCDEDNTPIVKESDNHSSQEEKKLCHHHEVVFIS
ncbi:hypothetical protein [Legionella brunensis]|uniref:Uncharacterized protein n=1 Tax=Legionella brunensis TaxID=29422 RepID=A0A0W0STX0_9GAMM|nr:hypothetical protein [Legionella brunensis]KTC86822.1 hypothetical protein Lbru_0763 [Legionella brunensis]